MSNTDQKAFLCWTDPGQKFSIFSFAYSTEFVIFFTSVWCEDDNLKGRTKKQATTSEVMYDV